MLKLTIAFVCTFALVAGSVIIPAAAQSGSYGGVRAGGQGGWCPQGTCSKVGTRYAKSPANCKPEYCPGASSGSTGRAAPAGKK
jgi:hypothetical protein